MEFDKSRMCTVVNTDEVKLGSIGYFADNIHSLHVEEPGKEELRPYKDVNEMVEDFVKRFNVNVQPYEMPLIWIKTEDADKKYLIVRFASAVTICHNVEVYTLTFEDLAEAYTYLDGSPCGMKE